jgi:hypothetical protein
LRRAITKGEGGEDSEERERIVTGEIRREIPFLKGKKR